MPGGGTSARNEDLPRQNNALDKACLEGIFTMKYLLPQFSDKIKFVLLENHSWKPPPLHPLISD